MIKDQTHREKLLNKITTYLRKKSLLYILVALLKSILIGLILFTIFSFSEVLFYFSPTVKTILVLLLVLSMLGSFVIFSFKQIKNYINSKTINEISKGSDEIGNHFSDIRDTLLNSIQLVEQKKSSSVSLTNAAFEETYKKVKHLNFIELLDYSYLKKYLIIFCILLVLIISSQFVNNIRTGTLRFLSFANEYVKPDEFALEILTKNARIKKGDDFVLKVQSHGIVPDNIVFSLKSISESEFKDHIVKKDSNNIYSFNLRNVQNSFSFFAYKTDVKSEIFNISVVSPPKINSIIFQIIPPKYSRLPKTTQENNGNISALIGSEISFEIISTKELESAKRVTSDGKDDSLKVNGKNIFGKFRIKNIETYHFELLDAESYVNENPIEYSIKIIEDSFPVVEIIRPEQISLAPSNDILNISYSIKDDFGFSKLSLNYLKDESNSDMDLDNFESTNLIIDKNELEQSLFYNWDISRFGLRENDIISYFLAISDNDNISGPKISRTPIYKLRIPSLNELFTQAEDVQDSAVEELTETLKEAEDLQKELEQIGNELKQNEKNIDWNEKERIEEASEKFEEIADKLEDVQEKLENMRKNMSENNLLSDETMQKYNELQDLMDELNSDELKKAMQDMQNSLEQLMRDKVQQSLENLSMNEKMFQKSIERTLNLLKKIQIEQKMDEVIKRTEKITEDLEKLSNETKNNSTNENAENDKELVKNQKKIDEQLKSLEEQLENLKNKMNDVDDMPQQKMEDIKNEFDDQKNEELSNEAMKHMQENNKFDALKNQQKMSENMNSMKEQLQQMKQQMQQQSQQMVMQKMLKAIDNIIGLSKEQESLKNDNDNSKNSPEDFKNSAQSQMELQQNLDNILKQLSELSQKSFAITPEMGEALGRARSNMNEAISGMQNKNGQRSSNSQGEAMKNMNEAAAFLQNSFQSMMKNGGQGSGGMMSMMQQLQQMAQQQMGLNKMTQMMRQGQLSMQQQAQLQRLGQEQAAIQKSLQELNREAREAGESKKISSNLEKILNDMNEVISGLNTKKVDDDLIKTQEKILSKLLDAQKSINERDFEKNRESFTGKKFQLDSPSELLLNKERAQDALREELLKSVKEGYSKDYQDLIRRYFESLNNKVKGN